MKMPDDEKIDFPDLSDFFFEAKKKYSRRKFPGANPNN
jgi:hypothetical protein